MITETINPDYIIEDVTKSLYDYRRHKEATAEASVSTIKSNVVDREHLRDVQLKVMNELKSYLAHTFGPMGSNTMILEGNSTANLHTKYTKDGHNVLSKIQYMDPIENTICKELETITSHVEHVVGDGTTSAVELSATIFEYLDMLMHTTLAGYPPYMVIRSFKAVVKDVQEEIMKYRKDITLDDIYNICMTSTNGDQDVSDMITQVYGKYGFDVDISVGISNDTNTKLKTYDGLVLDEPYSDPAYINRIEEGVCELHNPRIYAFQDPVDTPEMVSLFEKIVNDNIIEPIQHNEDMIPTVILATKFSRDISPMIVKMVSLLNTFVGANASQKPPILIVTNITTVDEDTYHDIMKLCGCPLIRKYIDPEIQQHDIETGMAPTLDTVANFCGKAEMVVSDNEKTKFVNPQNMYDENGDPGSEYTALMEWLKAELKSAQNNNESIGTIGHLKKRIRAIGGNMVEYLIGGIDVKDRDSKRDLVIDAVKNCKSASVNGVGTAANIEALIAIRSLIPKYSDPRLGKEFVEPSIDLSILQILYTSYYEVIRSLYMTVLGKTEAEEKIEESIVRHRAMNLYNLQFDGKVCCSIDLDIRILDAISKIVTVMATSNQCILQAPGLNKYI